MAQYLVAGRIVNLAGQELGLLTSDTSDVYASTDANVIQLRVFLRALGRRLCRQNDWPQLRDLYTATYSGPILLTDLNRNSSLLRIISGTEWNQTTRTRLYSMSSQQYVAATASGISGLNNQNYYFLGGFGPTLTLLSYSGTPTITFEYTRDLWIGPSDGEDIIHTSTGTTGETPTDYTGPNADIPTQHNDVCYLDGDLLIAGIKLEWARAKGFDTTTYQQEYTAALNAALASGSPAAVLSLTGGGGDDRLIDARNVPDTGYGS